MPTSRQRQLDRDILKLALPAIGSGLTTLAYLWIDTFWAGRLEDSRPALAALTIATFTRWIFGSIALVIGTGLTALVARYLGAGRPGVAAYVSYQGFLGALLLGTVTAVSGWVAAPLVYSLVSEEAAVIEAGSQYVRIFWCGGFVLLLQRASDATFRARGDSTTPFTVALLGLALNAALDPILMFGNSFVPAMGLAGASLATVLSAGVSATVSIALLRRRAWVTRSIPTVSEIKLRQETRVGEPGFLGVDRAILTRVARVGIPMAWSGVVFSVIYLVISKTVDHYHGSAAVAALGLGHSGESFAFMICNGFAVAAATLVGQRLGAVAPEEAKRCAWRATAFCSFGCAAWAILLATTGHWIAAWIAPEDPAIQELAASYYLITSLCLVPQAFELTLEGAFSGAGMTVPPMVVTVVLSAIRIPLAWWLSGPLGLDVSAIWWMLCLTAIARAVAMTWWFQLDTWRDASV